MAELSKIEQRRQRARDAFYGEYTETAPWDPHLNAAIETATRVKITDAAIDAYYLAGQSGPDVKGGLAAALAELGFEVEE